MGKMKCPRRRPAIPADIKIPTMVAAVEAIFGHHIGGGFTCQGGLLVRSDGSFVPVDDRIWINCPDVLEQRIHSLDTNLILLPVIILVERFCAGKLHMNVSREFSGGGFGDVLLQLALFTRLCLLLVLLWGLLGSSFLSSGCFLFVRGLGCGPFH